jgi:hypothetical protein
MTRHPLAKVSTTVVVAENILDRDTWVSHSDIKNLAEFFESTLLPKFGGRFPETGRIYHEKVDQQHDVTPTQNDPGSLNRLLKLTGTIYVVVWPNGQAMAIQLGISLALFLVTTVIKALLPDEKVKSRQVAKGSPNNLPGDRQNTARALQRIPDIYGRVKSTPDLIQYPYISYENNLQIETVFACIGRGEFEVLEEEIFEGATPITHIEGHSVAIYPPGQVPGSGTPQLEVGEPIEDTVLVVTPVREVTGQPLLAPNNVMIFGDDEYGDETYDLGFEPHAPLFEYLGSGVGTISFNFTNWNMSDTNRTEYITNTLSVGDKIGLDWKGRTYDAINDIQVQEAYWGAVSVDHFDLTMGDDQNIPDLQILPNTPDDDHYLITNIDDSSPVDCIITIDIPTSKQAEWEKIALFNDGTLGDAPAGTIYNRQFIIYLLNYRIGPFFVNDPNMSDIHLNFVADRGLWIDDGTEQRPYGQTNNIAEDPGGVEIAIEVTPADELGAASGTKEIYYHTLFGSATKRDFIAETAKITPTFTGRFLVGVYRNTLAYWRRVALSWQHPTTALDTRNWRESGNSNPFATNIGQSAFDPSGRKYQTINGTFADDIKLTHIYSMSPARYLSGVVADFGNITTVHCRTSQLRNSAASNVEKRLNMIVTRKLPLSLLDGTFLPADATTRGIDAVFDMLLDPTIGNVPAEQIDFASIAQAFQDVNASMVDGNDATTFSETFDSENSSLEDMLAAVAESCFVILYRQGNIIRGKADVSTADATLIFNHRNKIPGSENRTVNFGTEEDYDGVEVEYTDIADEQIKVYGIPAPGSMRNPRKIRVAGVKTRAKAAMHAWRAYNRLLYQKVGVEFDACEEAALCLVKDKVLVADGTRPIYQDGEITEIDGLTVYTSQAVDLTGPGDYTLFVQDVDGTTQALPVEASTVEHSLTLGGAPSGSLVIDPVTGQFPRYILSRDLGTLPKAFQVVESSFKSRGVYGVTVVNYTEGYYFNDAIYLYVPFQSTAGYPPVRTFDDRSPYENAWEVDNNITVTTDPSTPSRGQVCLSTDTGDALDYPDFTSGTSQPYTIALWLNRTVGDTTFLAFSLSGSALSIFLDEDGLLTVEHDGVEQINLIDVGIELGVWQHLCFTYDPDTEILTAYLDGEVVDTVVDVPVHTSFTGLRIVFGLDGMCDDYRFYRKCQTAEFVRELYMRTRVS